MRFPWSKPKTDPIAEAILPQAILIPVEVEPVTLDQPTIDAIREEVRSTATIHLRDATETALARLGMPSGVATAQQLASAPSGTPAGMPGTPLQFTDPSKTTWQGAYKLDRPLTYSTPVPPQHRPGSAVTLDTLRKLADNYDVLRACIQHLKREVTAVPLKIVAKDDKDQRKSTLRAIKEAEAFFSSSGGLGGVGIMRAQFESELIEDLCIIGNCATFFAPSRKGLLEPRSPGALWSVQTIDAATLRPAVDAFGFQMQDYPIEQWVWGVLIGGYTREQMFLGGLPVNSRTWSPYPASPVEWLLGAINSALRADDWNRKWLTDGNTPSQLYGVPMDWTPDMIMQFQMYMDALLTGNTAARQKARLVPGTMSQNLNPTRKDQDFATFELWLLRRTCAIMGVQPASIGFAGEQYKVSQEDSMESTSWFGAGVILNFRADYYTEEILPRLGYSQLMATNVTGREEKSLERAQRNEILVRSGIKRVNEARLDEGLDPDKDGDKLFVVGMGATSLEQVVTPPEPAQDVADPNHPNSQNNQTLSSQKPKPGGTTQPKLSNAAKRLLQMDRDKGLLRMELRRWQRREDRYAILRSVNRPSVVLLRHGPTSKSGTDALGWMNVPLMKPDGKDVATQEAQLVAPLGIEQIRTSDLKRAVQTAKVLRDVSSAPITERTHDLRAWNIGDFAGRPLEEARPLLADYAQNRPDVSMPSGESFHDFTTRTLGYVGTVLQDVQDNSLGTTALVCHAPVIKAVCSWLDMGRFGSEINPETYLELQVPMGAVLWIRQDDDDDWCWTLFDATQGIVVASSDMTTPSADTEPVNDTDTKRNA